VIKLIINYLKNVGYIIAGILITTIMITLLNYFGILSGITLKITLITTIILALFIGGYLTGKKANKKGYLEGIKFGLIMIVLILLLNILLFKNEFTLLNILYYLSLLISSTIGSIIGIQRKN